MREHQLIKSLCRLRRICQTDDLYVNLPAGQAKDRPVQAVAVLESFQDRQPNRVPVEGDRLVVTRAPQHDTQRTDRKIGGQCSCCGSAEPTRTVFIGQAISRQAVCQGRLPPPRAARVGVARPRRLRDGRRKDATPNSSQMRLRARFILGLSGSEWSPRQGSRPSGKRGTRLGSDLDANNVSPSSRSPRQRWSRR
jgi:hypothetical protein